MFVAIFIFECNCVDYDISSFVFDFRDIICKQINKSKLDFL